MLSLKFSIFYKQNVGRIPQKECLTPTFILYPIICWAEIASKTGCRSVEPWCLASKVFCVSLVYFSGNVNPICMMFCTGGMRFFVACIFIPLLFPKQKSYENLKKKHSLEASSKLCGYWETNPTYLRYYTILDAPQYCFRNRSLFSIPFWDRSKIGFNLLRECPVKSGRHSFQPGRCSLRFQKCSIGREKSMFRLRFHRSPKFALVDMWKLSWKLRKGRWGMRGPAPRLGADLR